MVFVDKCKKRVYTVLMKNVFSYYISRNGIRFHHTKTEQESLENDPSPAELHDECEIFLLLSGDVTYQVEGQTFALKVGDMFIVPPNLLHSRVLKGDEPYERMVLHFNPDLLPQIQDLDVLSFSKRANEYAYVLSCDIVQKSDIVDQIYKIKELCRTEGKYRDLHLITAITQMTETLNELASEMINHRTIALRSTKNNISYLCIEYINAHLDEKLSAEQVSKALNISASHLQSVFKKEIGLSLHKYILTQKMHLARTLLHQGMPAQEVAQRLGFEYYATFHQAYRRVCKTAPRTYSKIAHTLVEDRKA